MFTGIVTDIGRIRAIERRGDVRYEIETAYDTASIEIGASIACAGACLTVIETGADWFKVDASAETLSKTTLGEWREGARINLERALAVGDEIGGHLVSGHVDGTTEILDETPSGDSVEVSFALAEWLAPYIAPQDPLKSDFRRMSKTPDAQGWFVGKPMLSQDLLDWLRESPWGTDEGLPPQTRAG